MAIPHIPWKQHERTATRRLVSPLREFRALARFAHRFFDVALQLTSGRKVPEAGRVQAQIVSQLSLQVRLVELAAERGYALQAAANVAAAYELAAAVGFVAADSTRASKWLVHSNTRHSYPDSKQRATAMRSLLELGGVEPAGLDREVADWEQRYEFYCMAKHGNPHLLRRYGITVSGTTIKLHHGPTVGNGYDVMAQYAVFRAAQLLVYAVPIFGNPLAQSTNASDLREYVRFLKEVPRFMREAALRLPQRNGAV